MNRCINFTLHKYYYVNRSDNERLSLMDWGHLDKKPDWLSRRIFSYRLPNISGTQSTACLMNGITLKLISLITWIKSFQQLTSRRTRPRLRTFLSEVHSLNAWQWCDSSLSLEALFYSHMWIKVSITTVNYGTKCVWWICQYVLNRL